MIGTLDNGSEDEQFKYGQFGGFWHLIEVQEVKNQNNKKLKPQKKKFPKPVSVLFELDIMCVTWFINAAEPQKYPFHLVRKKIITQDVFSQIQIIVKYVFEGHIMKWTYIVNFDKENYSEYRLIFKRDI